MRQSEFKRRFDVKTGTYIKKHLYGKGVVTDVFKTIGQRGGFLIPQDKINQLIAYKHLRSTGQKRDILNALQTGNETKNSDLV